MTEDERFNEQLRQVIREMEPPTVPREELWARIEAERAARRAGVQAAPRDVIPLRRRMIRPAFTWSAALAATLVIGIGLGRLSNRVSSGASTQPAETTAATVTDTPADAVPAAYRLVATRHLQQTETLLASLTVDAGATSTDEVSRWARDLLTDTRLLLSSPAAQDPTLRGLLEDLELLLAQVSTIPSARAAQEVELIQQGINQSDVLLRLRAATAGRRLVGT